MRHRLQAGAKRLGHGIAGVQNFLRASSIVISKFEGIYPFQFVQQEVVAFTATLMTWVLLIGKVGLRAEIRGLSRCGETPMAC